MNSYLQVRIISPKQLFYNDKALSVSSKNSLGKFDILPFHANFVTIVESQPIMVQKLDRSKINFNFTFALIYHVNNIVNIYADISLPTLSK